MDAALSRRSYGWSITWTLAITETLSWGILYYAFSAFMVPMQDDLGWSSGQLTGAYSIAMLVSGLAAPFVGRWLDAHGPRAIMTIGSIAGTALMLSWSRIETLPGFYLLWIGLGLASAMVLYEPAFATIAQWFGQAERSRAMLIVTVAAGFASTIFLPLSGWLIERQGWRPALVSLAVIVGVGTILPHALVLRDAPRRRDAQARGAGMLSTGVLRNAQFWWMTIAFFLQTFASIAIGVHLIAYLTERGDGATFAATATGLIGAAQVAARVATTMLEGRWSMTRITGVVFASQAVAIVMLIELSSSWGVIAAALVLGMGRGAITLIRPTMLVDMFGTQQFGAISGMQAMVLTFARGLAPVAAGAAYGWFGGYDPVFWWLAAIAVVSAVAVVPMRSAMVGQPDPA